MTTIIDRGTTMRQRFADTVVTLLDTDRRIVVVTADIGAGAFTDAHRRHPHRVINVGIREQAMIGVAAGFALEGFRPIVHSYAPFLVERPYEQLKLDLSHQGTGAIVVSTGASFDAAAEGRTHQAPADVALIASLPGWEVHVPGHADEMERLLKRAATRSANVYLRMSTQVNRAPHHADEVRIVRRGEPGAPTVLAVGPMLDPVLEATVSVDATVAYTHTVKPLDAPGLRRAVTGTDVVLVEPALEGTSAAAVVGALSDRPHRLLTIGVQDREVRRYGSAADHAAEHGLDAAGLRARITAFVR